MSLADREYWRAKRKYRRKSPTEKLIEHCRERIRECPVDLTRHYQLVLDDLEAKCREDRKKQRIPKKGTEAYNVYKTGRY